MIGNTLNLLGLIAKRNGQYALARQYFHSLIAHNFKRPKTKWQGRAYHNIGNAYMEEGRYDSAEVSFYMALKYKLNRNLSQELFITYLDMTELYLSMVSRFLP